MADTGGTPKPPPKRSRKAARTDRATPGHAATTDRADRTPAGRADVAPRARAREDLEAEALELVAHGWFVSHACAEVGIPIRTWEDRVTREPDFAARVERARAAGERAHLDRAREDVDEGRSHAYETWLLERLHPARYRPPQPQAVAVVGVGQATTLLDGIAAAARALTGDVPIEGEVVEDGEKT